MKQVNIIAVAGFGTVYSYGLDLGVLMPLRRYQGPKAPIDYMKFVPYRVLDRMTNIIKSWRDDTYFLCHSYGVRSVMRMIRKWNGAGPNVPLVISFDPSQWVWPGANDVPAHVEHVHNFWQRGWPIGYQRLRRVRGGTNGIVNEEVDATHRGIDDLVYTQNKSLKMLKLKINIKE